MRLPKRLQSFILWALAFLLFWLALRDIDWRAVSAVLAELTLIQIGVLFLVNAIIVVLLGVRWWLILRAQGYRFPLIRASSYRLAAFGISYFTPGPHFGGEPLQVFMAVKREGVPASAATASVALDKLLELTSNFAFLVFGVAIMFNGGLIDNRSGPLGMAFATSLLILPLAYLVILVEGKRPLTSMLDRQSRKFTGPESGESAGWVVRIKGLIRSAESETADFVRYHKFTFFAAVLLSGVVWVALVLEFMLLVRFLGLALGFRQVISVITAARLAILLPMPGGLGTLEAAIILVTEAMGQGAAAGAGLSLLIRVRDIIFGLIGLWLGRKLATLNE